MYLVMSSDTPVVVGAFVTIIAGFLAVAKIMLGQATKDREADRKERIKLSDAIALMAENSGRMAQGIDKVAEETAKGAKQAEDRNGHLAELITQQSDVVQNIADAAVGKIITSVSNQHVDVQKVDTQVIKK